MRISVSNVCFVLGLHAIYNGIGKTYGNSHRCKPPVLKHGIVQTVNGVAQFECMSGFELLGSSYSSCVDASWKPDLPFCIKSGCERIPPLENGERIYLKSNAYIIFICKSNYTLRGPTTIYCDGNEWNDEPPSCTKIFPNQNKDNEKITKVIKEKEAAIETTTMSDLDRYLMNMKSIEEEIMWELHKSENIELDCPRPDLVHGDVRLRNNGRMARYICWEGFELLGSKNSFCVDGEWNSETPFCIKPGCERLPILENGIEIFAKRDAFVKFMCKPGYEIDINKTIHCDGTNWNDTIPNCIGECPTPSIANGITISRHRGRLVKFRCLKGFKLLGNRFSECVNGQWNEVFPRCISMTNPTVEVTTELEMSFTEYSEIADVTTSAGSSEESIYLVYDNGSTAKYYLDRFKNHWVHNT